MKVIISVLVIICFSLNSCIRNKNETRIEKIFVSKSSYGIRVVIDSVTIRSNYPCSTLDGVVLSGFPYAAEELQLTIRNVCSNSNGCNISFDYDTGIIPTFFFYSADSLDFFSHSDSMQRAILENTFKNELDYHLIIGHTKLQLIVDKNFDTIIINDKNRLTM